MVLLLCLHALSTTMMAGLIWFVQLVHYPLFACVGPAAFMTYERQHVRRVTWLVAPLMGMEAVSAILLPLFVPSGAARWMCVVGLVLVFVAWASTALLQVPCHRRLSGGFHPTVVQRLVQTNWVRTVAWSIRAGLAIVLLTLMVP